MTECIQALIKILTEQASLYENLIILSQRKKQVLIDNDITALQSITAQENSYVIQNNLLETKRNSITNAPNLDAIVKLATKKTEKDTLQDLTNHIKQSVQQLQKENEQNRLLLNLALEYFEFTRNLFRSALTREPNVAQDVFFDIKQ